MAGSYRGPNLPTSKIFSFDGVFPFSIPEVALAAWNWLFRRGNGGGGGDPVPARTGRRKLIWKFVKMLLNSSALEPTQVGWHDNKATMESRCQENVCKICSITKGLEDQRTSKVIWEVFIWNAVNWTLNFSWILEKQD